MLMHIKKALAKEIDRVEHKAFITKKRKANKLSKLNEMMEDLEFVGRECFDWGVRQA